MNASWCSCMRWIGFALLLLVPVPIVAQETLRETTSLGFVPADTPFYAAWLRNQEQFEALARSRAIRKLASLPIAKEIKKALLEGLHESAAEEGIEAESLRDWATKPENAELLVLLADLASTEVFVLGDASFYELSKKISEKTREVQALSTTGDDVTEEKIAAIEALIKDLNAPNLLFGFKLRDTKRAERQIARLEERLKKGIEIPAAKPEADEDDDAKKPEAAAPRVVKFDRLKHVDINGGHFLQLPLDGSQIPWDELKDENQTEKQKDLLKRIVPLLQKKTLTVNLGTWKDYLLVSLGADSRPIEALGKGKPLYDHPQLALLRKYADRRISGVGFVSDEFIREATKAQGEAGVFAQWGRQLEAAEALPEKLKTTLLEDLKKLDADVLRFTPKPGGSISFSFLTDGGHESYGVDWSENRRLEPSQKLSILSHVGGKPVYVSASRSKSSLEEWKTFAKWVARADYYLREFVGPQLGAQQMDLEKVLDEVGPLLKRFDRATQDLMYPALADGQSAFVIDGAKPIRAKQTIGWETDRTLPVLLPALVYGVSDAGKLKSGLTEYRAVLDALDEYLNERSPLAAFMPLIQSQLESQATSEVEVEAASKDGVDYKTLRGTKYPGNEDFSPTASLSKSFAVLTLTRGHAERLQKSSPVTLAGPAADLNRPLAAVSHLDLAQLVEVARAWYEAAAEHRLNEPAIAETDPEDPLPEEEPTTSPEEAAKEAELVRAVMDVLHCIQGYSSVTYQDGKTLVRHSEWRYSDLK